MQIAVEFSESSSLFVSFFFSALFVWARASFWSPALFVFACLLAFLFLSAERAAFFEPYAS
jgi:hypothetical protein